MVLNIMINNMQKIKYDTSKWNWQKDYGRILPSVIPLCDIKNNIDVLKRENDQSTMYHALFYLWADTNWFKESYSSFIKEVVRPLYNESIVVQKIPTFRICFPNNIAVGEFHKDRWYRDESWAKNVQEDNFFLPFTDAFGNNTIQVESEEDKGDYSPMECEYGEMIQWDGSNLTHGNNINDTGKCRVSVDFRVIKLSNYLPSEHGSINMKTKFKLGEYYQLIN